MRYPNKRRASFRICRGCRIILNNAKHHHTVDISLMLHLKSGSMFSIPYFVGILLFFDFWNFCSHNFDSLKQFIGLCTIGSWGYWKCVSVKFWISMRKFHFYHNRVECVKSNILSTLFWIVLYFKKKNFNQNHFVGLPFGFRNRWFGIKLKLWMSLYC